MSHLRSVVNTNDREYDYVIFKYYLYFSPLAVIIHKSLVMIMLFLLVSDSSRRAHFLPGPLTARHCEDQHKHH